MPPRRRHRAWKWRWITRDDENYSPPREGRCEKIGRASLLPSLVRQGFAGTIALPISAGFEFFHTSRSAGVGCPEAAGPTSKATPSAPSPEGIFTEGIRQRKNRVVRSGVRFKP